MDDSIDYTYFIYLLVVCLISSVIKSLYIRNCHKRQKRYVLQQANTCIFECKYQINWISSSSIVLAVAVYGLLEFISIENTLLLMGIVLPLFILVDFLLFIVAAQLLGMNGYVFFTEKEMVVFPHLLKDSYKCYLQEDISYCEHVNREYSSRSLTKYYNYYFFHWDGPHEVFLLCISEQDYSNIDEHLNYLQQSQIAFFSPCRKIDFWKRPHPDLPFILLFLIIIVIIVTKAIIQL